jgi:hypothetical protein
MIQRTLENGRGAIQGFSDEDLAARYLLFRYAHGDASAVREVENFNQANDHVNIRLRLRAIGEMLREIL